MVGSELERVFRAEYPRIVAVARRVLGDDRAAEDVAQEVFVEYAAGGVPAGRSSGWLTVAATHRALNVLRGERRRSAREQRAGRDPALTDDVAPDIADGVLLDADRARLRAVLTTLPRTQASVLLLRHSGLSYADIAEALDVPVSGIGTTLRRAEAALREEWNRHGSRD